MDTTNKPKIVATIEINPLDLNQPIPRVTKQDWMRESIEEHLNCGLCGTEIEFTRRTDFITHVVAEDAHCPGCRARRRQTLHNLQ